MSYCEFEDDYDDESDFECPECGEETDEEDICWNAECPNYKEEVFRGDGSTHASDAAAERKQMGITS